MSIIKPFQGFRPSSDMVAKVSSPPYDVMTSDEARDMVQDNPYSFLRVINLFHPLNCLWYTFFQSYFWIVPELFLGLFNVGTLA